MLTVRLIRHGESAANSELVARVQAALGRLAALPVASVALFGHGQFMQAVRWWIACKPAALDADAMREFRAFDLALCSMLFCLFAHDKSFKRLILQVTQRGERSDDRISA